MKASAAKHIILKAAGIAFCTLPVMLAVLFYFPVWRARGGEAVISGFTLFLLLLCFVPMFKTMKKILHSPSAYTMWFIAFIAFFILSSIAEEMTVISFVGFIGNLIGAVFFKISEKDERSKDEGQL